MNAPPSGALATGKGRFSVGRMSAAVNTPATPGAAAASSVSIETISACGYGLRTTARWSAPGSGMSGVYWA